MFGLYHFNDDHFGRIPDAQKKAVTAVRELGGWIQRQSYDRVSFRVPVKKFEAAVESVCGLGTVNRREIEAIMDLLSHWHESGLLSKEDLTFGVVITLDNKTAIIVVFGRTVTECNRYRFVKAGPINRKTTITIIIK